MLLECAALLHEAGYPRTCAAPLLPLLIGSGRHYLYGWGRRRLFWWPRSCGGRGLAGRGGIPSAALPEKQRLLAGKLAAVLALADALDCARRGADFRGEGAS